MAGRGQATSRPGAGRLAPRPAFVAAYIRGTTLLALGINALGVAVVGLLLLARNTHATSEQRLVLGIVGAGYGLAAVAAGAVLGFVLEGRTLRWIAAGRSRSSR